MSIEKIIYFGKPPVVSALEHYRIYAPLQHAGVTVIPGFDDGGLHIEGINAAQLVVFQRDFSRDFRAYQRVIGQAEEMGVPVVLDLDDNFLALPPEHPDRKTHYYTDSLSPLLHAIMQADALTVTTPYLREMLLPYNARIYVLPNYLDADFWQFKAPAPVRNNNPVRILFVGTPTHKPDLEMIAGPLERIANKYGDGVQLHFYGCEPPNNLLPLPQCSYQPVRTYAYKEFVREMQTLEADIAIAPLVDSPFNRCKSAVKYLEYSAMGLPGVYGHLEPYSRIVSHGEDAFLAASPQEWEEYVSRLIDDPALREQIATKAQEKLRRDWLLQDHADAWQKVYQKVLGQKKHGKPAPPALLDALASIGQQVREQAEDWAQVAPRLATTEQANASLRQTKAIQEQRIESLQVQIDQAQQEISQQADELHTAHISLEQKEHTIQESAQALELTREEVSRLSDELQSTLGLLEENEQTLQETRQALELSMHEVVDYTSSASWKLTRPLRRLARFLRRK